MSLQRFKFSAALHTNEWHANKLCEVSEAAALSKKPKRLPLPPGPPADPFIGHLRKMPRDRTSETLHEWSKIYGPIMSLRVPNRDIIVLGSADAAQEVLENRGRNYSCRPKFTVFQLCVSELSTELD